jgi:two-component system, NtrC family, sensor histidine kinase HydH
MGSSLWVDVLTFGVQLLLAAAAFSRIRRADVARSLGFFCLCVSVWTGSALAFELTRRIGWVFLDRATSPFTAALALDFALTFDGRRRMLRTQLLMSYLACGTLGAMSVVAVFAPSLRGFLGSRGWNAWMLGVGIPTVFFAFVSIVAHLQRSVDRAEEERGRLVLAAFVVASLFGVTDLLSPVALGVPSLSRIGLALASMTLAVVSLRFAWLDSAVVVRRCLYAVAAVGVGLLVYIGVFGVADRTASGLLLATVTVVLALALASRRWMVDAAVHKERVSQLASLGRFSAQMAHDLKNPLAALKGAAQLLREDMATPALPASGRGPSSIALVDLLLEQIDRLGRVVDTYGRLTRIDVDRTTVRMNDVVREVTRQQELARRDDVKLEAHLAEQLPECQADRDMLASVLENLVRNAVEALPEGGRVTVRTWALASGGVGVTVEDNGVGMDAPTRERAFDDFFTTKPTGSGLGLAFVRRVVEAHGGDVSLASAPGRGTVVRIELPRGVA